MLQHLDVLADGGQGLLGQTAGEGCWRRRMVAGDIDPAGPGEGEVVGGGGELLSGMGLGGVGSLPGEEGHG